MPSVVERKHGLNTRRLLSLLLLNAVVWAQVRNAKDVRIPDRATAPLFTGEQGKQKTELHFDPATGVVTIKLVVQDRNGYFIQNIRRNNFWVYENGVPQKGATVEIEHAPVSLAVLMENGGHYVTLNKAVTEEVSTAIHRLRDTLGPDDKVAVWRYGDTAEQLSGFSKDRQALPGLADSLKAPGVSEANLYDALLSIVTQMQPVSGRKAIILISSGVDTFSKAKFEDTLKAIAESGTPIYVIGLAPILRLVASP